MSTASLSEDPPARSLLERLAGLPLWVWCLVTWTVIALRTLSQRLPTLADHLGDTDDALRLSNVRDLLAGQGWFDLVQWRIAPPDGLSLHWSRLLDAPLAALLALLRLLLPVETAELVLRAVWPLLLLMPLVFVVARAAARLGGKEAGYCALMLMALAGFATAQFLPGRIDHHNLMILSAVGTIILLGQMNAHRHADLLAGMLAGAGFAIGLEAIALVGMVAGLYVLAAIRSPQRAAQMAQFFAALALTSGLLMAVTLPFPAWFQPWCDTIAANYVVLAAVPAVGLTLLASRIDRLDRAGRAAALVAIGVTGVAAFGAMEPACLAGPFGKVDPALFPIWLDHVTEGRSVVWNLREDLITGLTVVAFLVVGAAAAGWLALRERTEEAVIGALAIIVALALGLWQLKLQAYATILAIPPIAVVIAGLGGTRHLTPLAAKLLALLLVNQTTIVLVAKPVSDVFSAAGAKSNEDKTQHAKDRDACFSGQHFAALAALPPGRVVAHVDLGPFVIAHTQHTVQAAPYHRLGQAMVANERVFSSTPTDSRRLLASLGADYLVDCMALTGPAGPHGASGLRSVLRRGDTPDFLAPVAGERESPLLVWRVSR